MPIVVTCPKCPTKLSAPESAAGKQVRCPKCGAAAPVPAFEVVEEPAVVDATPAPPPTPAPKPMSQPVLAEAADDGDESLRKKPRDDEEERPRKKKKKRYDDDDDYEHDQPRRKRRPNKSGGGGAMVAVIIVGGLLLLVGVGAVIVFAVGGSSLLAKRAPVPPGWQQYSFPDEGFTLYAPQKPARIGLNLTHTPSRRGGMFGGDDFDEMELLSSFASGNLNEVRVEVAVIRFRDRVPATARSQVENGLPDQFRGGQMRPVRWLGAEGQEWTRQGWVIRVVCNGRYIVLAAIRGPNDARVTKVEEDGFFDNIELTK